MSESPDRILRFLDRAYTLSATLLYTLFVFFLGIMLGVALSMIYGVEKWTP